MPKKTKKTTSDVDVNVDKHVHEFTSDEEQSIRAKLLEWYDQNKRDLPWRRRGSESDRNKRGYAVWVSEIMLQQTQVVTVIDYYNRWMQRWPTMQDLAKASLEDVNECWSGLGYYSRARRLYEGSKKVCEDLHGNMPANASDLQKQLPGVGRYTAGAIASIAFNEATGVVDGNVIRVLSRLQVIGADSTSNTAIDKFWQLANSLVDEARPGDFNQAMMELGATVCTPKTPHCANCPLSQHCMAFKQVEDFRKNKKTEFVSTLNNNNSCKANTTDITDIEICNLCLPASVAWDSALGVTNYPTKSKRKEIKEETYQACLVKNCTSRETQFLIVQRPETGLLAGMWEFPNMECDPDMSQPKLNSKVLEFLSEKLGLSNLENQKEVGEITHRFSHRHHTYKVTSFSCDMESSNQTAPNGQCMKWMSKEELQDAAIPTAMRKILKLYEDSMKKGAPAAKKRKINGPDCKGNQKTMESFFKPRPK